jgi:altronate hydrolase
VLLDGADMDALSEELMALCLAVANGKQSKSEEKGFYDIAIFKDGVTL